MHYPQREMRDSRKKWLFPLLLCAMVLIASEGIAQFFYLASHGARYQPGDLYRHAGQQQVDEAPDFVFAEIAQRRILHPYLGYAMDRRETMGGSGKLHPLQKRGEGKFIVAVTGGSVANQVRSVLGQALRRAFEERGLQLEPVVIGLSVDGFKQPQQLASVNYFLAIGAEFDAVVNVDGFNDIVLPIVDNYANRIYPFYPRSWSSFANRRPSQTTILGAGEIAFLRQRQKQRVSDAGASLFGHSAIHGLYAALNMRRDGARIGEIQQLLLAEKVDLTFEAQGPFEEHEDTAEVYAAAARLWSNSSILMKHVLEGAGTAYFHVLQPNQYVAGSKQLSESEKEIAFDMDHPYAQTATRGYPYLFDASNDLVEAGVQFFDATPVFRDIAEDVYQDKCCHMNKFGKRLFARSIADWVADSMSAPSE